MLEKTLLIVSDKFHHFTSRKDVITKAELYHLLTTENAIFSGAKKIRLIPGQGFSKDDVNNLLNMSKIARNASFFDFRLWRRLPERASKKITHKHKEENILISSPKRLSKDEFLSDILIDEECEMMNDHQTGLHVQGMILLEASRQAYLAIFEKYFYSDCTEKKYFILNSLNVNYNRFAFPLPATLSVTIKKINMSNPKKQYAIMDMQIIQCGDVSASFSLEMTMMASKRIESMESKLADHSLNEHINHLLYSQEIREAAHA
jgi:hypothetical protein